MMKIKKIRVCYVYLSLTVVSCLSCESITSQEHEVKDDSLAETQISISVDANHYPNWSEVIEKVEFIPLENTEIPLGGDLFEVETTPTQWLVLDIKRADEIFIFDKSGQFLRKISEIGRGPGEYTFITGFDVSSDFDQIMVHDSKVRKVVVYDTAGIFIHERESSLMFNDFIWKEDTLYLATGHTNEFDKNLHYALLKTDMELNVIDRQIPYEESKFNFSIGTLNRIHKNGPWSTIVPDLSNEVYRVAGRGIKPEYSIDFGSRWPSPSDNFFRKNKDLNTIELGDEMERRKYIKYFGAEESDKWLILHFYTFSNINEVEPLHVYLYDKENEKIYQATPEGEGVVYPQPLENSMYFKDDVLFWAVSAYQLKLWTEQQIEKGYQIDPQLKKLYENLDENDNPVVIQVYFTNIDEL